MTSRVLKSETRFKRIDTDNAATNADDYVSGDIVYDQDDGLLIHNGSNFEGIEAKFKGMFIDTGITEKLENLANPHETQEDYDCSVSQVFYNTIPSSGGANWRVNLLNFSIPTYSATTVVVIVNQDNSAIFYPDELTISSSGSRSGVLQTILWAGGTAPAPTQNGTDVFSFTIYNLSGASYYILAQMVPFKQLS